MFEWAETVGQQMMTAQKKKRLKYFIATDNDDVRTIGCSPPLGARVVCAVPVQFRCERR